MVLVQIDNNTWCEIVTCDVILEDCRLFRRLYTEAEASAIRVELDEGCFGDVAENGNSPLFRYN
jgi:hypothetical protein